MLVDVFRNQDIFKIPCIWGGEELKMFSYAFSILYNDLKIISMHFDMYV